MYNKQQLAVEISNFFIEKHGYKSLKLKTVEGIFLENRDNNVYQVIKISVEDILGFDEQRAQLESQVLVQTLTEYQLLSSLSEVKILNIVIGGNYQIQSELIKTINVNAPADFNTNEVIKNNYDVKNVSFIADNKSRDVIKSERDVVMLIRESQMKAIRMIKQQTRFSSTLRTSIVILMIFLMFQGFTFLNIPIVFGYFKPFVTELGEWYRLFASVFINESFLSAVLIVLIIKQPLMQLELLIKTRNIVIFTILSLIAFYSYLYFVGSPTYYIGSYPLVHIYLGGIFHVILNHKDFDLKVDYKLFATNFIFIGMLAILLLSVDMYLTMYSIAVGYLLMSLFGNANNFSKIIHGLSYVLSIGIFVFMYMQSDIVPYYSPEIQKSYITYLEDSNPEYAKVVESKLDLTIPSDVKK